MTPAGFLDQLQRRGALPRGVADDSREVHPGDLFLAFPGDSADGRHYLADAVARGAAAVIWESGDGYVWPPELDCPNLPCAGLRAVAGEIAHAVMGGPSRRLALLAVTGTNGKTTCTQWIARAWPHPCAVIGTLGAGFPGALQETGFTTPQAATLARCLAAFADAGAAACALEASSIGIAESRLAGAQVDTAIFTNLTRDHLDYHGTMEAYAAAKEALFRWPGLRAAVINLDDACGARLAAVAAAAGAAPVIGYTLAGGTAPVDLLLRAEDIRPGGRGLSFTLTLGAERAVLDCALIGRYNVANLLAVAGTLLAAGVPFAELPPRLQQLTPPPGRLQCVGGVGEPLVVIDYAHSPDALDNALQALREPARARGGRLWCVFGCGGDRDRGKRPLMGQVAARLADRVVLTSDNPRREDPHAILADIRAGAPEADVIAERGAAIARLVAEADAADVVLIAGKGHEGYQEIAGVFHPFSDLAEAEVALASRRELTRCR